MPDRPVFLDSNIIIYAYSGTDPKKADIARRVIAAGNIVISAQVINEFVAVTHRKFRQPLDVIDVAVREFLPFTHRRPLQWRLHCMPCASPKSTALLGMTALLSPPPSKTVVLC